MLRNLARTQIRAAPVFRPAQTQWLLNRPRAFADFKKADETVLPGSQSTKPPGDTVPEPPKVDTPAPEPITEANAPRTPPAPEDVQSGVPPLGTGTARVAPPSPLPQPKRAGRFRRFLTTLVILSTLGYAGGVYYSLISDNFHDFFTEYVPGGEDAVGYFEEREFRKRFPVRQIEDRNYPQIRGENKITIGKQSGISPRVKEEHKETGLAQKGAHVSAVEDKKPAEKKPVQEAKKDEKVDAASKPAKDDEAKSHKLVPKEEAKPAPAPVPESKPAPPATLVDHVAVPDAAEPVVQDVVKMLNDIITVINNDPNASKYESTITAAKSSLSNVVSEISTLKQKTKQEADDAIAAAHKQFDQAARELVSRLEQEMKEQEMHWREEYETEREKLSQSYTSKLSAEIDAAQKVAEQKQRNALIEQEIALQRKFAQSVKDKVEAERNGRLGKLEELSSSVGELEKLTGEWNNVVDANLATQHMHVALEAVKAAVSRYEHPTPFINELAALKEISAGNDVVSAAIASIPPTAYQRGIPSPAHLIDRFRGVAREVRKASLLPEDAGIASHAASAVLSKFMFSKKGAGMPQGDDVEAVLTRTEVLLEEGDLDGAAREMNGLQGWAGVLSRDWIGECRRVLETRQALDVIAAEARLQSLLVD